MQLRSHLHSQWSDRRRPCTERQKRQAGRCTSASLVLRDGKCPHTPNLNQFVIKNLHMHRNVSTVTSKHNFLFSSGRGRCYLRISPTERKQEGVDGLLVAPHSPDTTGMGHFVLQGSLQSSFWAWMAFSSFWIFTLILSRTPCSHHTFHKDSYVSDRLLPVVGEVYLQNSDVRGKNGVHCLLDVGVLFLHLVRVLTHDPAVF